MVGVRNYGKDIQEVNGFLETVRGDIEMSYRKEPARDIPVLHETDICVVGGSCTGVFAAVRAAYLALDSGRSVQDVDVGSLQKELEKGGSASYAERRL